MRTTVQIDEDVMRDLRQQADREGLSLTRLLNRLLRQGMTAARQAVKPARPYREKTSSMGAPRTDLTKALALAASLEDNEIRDKLARRK
jgi:hypothetical protein